MKKFNKNFSLLTYTDEITRYMLYLVILSVVFLSVFHTVTFCITYTLSSHVQPFPFLFWWLPSRVGHPFFSKECNVLAFFSILYKRTRPFFAFFSVLYKRMRRSLRSFTFFIKERGVLCILFGFISHTKIANLAKKIT